MRYFKYMSNGEEFNIKSPDDISVGMVFYNKQLPSIKWGRLNRNIDFKILQVFGIAPDARFIVKLLASSRQGIKVTSETRLTKQQIYKLVTGN